MHGSNGFDAVEFLDYIRAKRILFAVSCGVAVLVAVGVSLWLPKRYTATSSILIEAPQDTYPIVSTAMSQAYLESLKTYETLASSDTLFQRAIEHLHVEGSKGNVLKVSMPVNTAVIEISATLNDPRKAQALAQYIAEQTVALDQTLEGDRRAVPSDTGSAPESRRGRLHVIDPGVVPQQAIFPNTPLNVSAAFLASLAGTFAWLLLRFSYVRLQRERSERAYSLR